MIAWVLERKGGCHESAHDLWARTELPWMAADCREERGARRTAERRAGCDCHESARDLWARTELPWMAADCREERGDGGDYWRRWRAGETTERRAGSDLPWMC
jgi:hypothetical protein